MVHASTPVPYQNNQYVNRQKYIQRFQTIPRVAKLYQNRMFFYYPMLLWIVLNILKLLLPLLVTVVDVLFGNFGKLLQTICDLISLIAIKSFSNY